MFGGFGKERSALDAAIRYIYGPFPPPKTANLTDAIRIAHRDLLFGVVPLIYVEGKAIELNAGKMPYSTNDLAASVALHFFRERQFSEVTKSVQLSARKHVSEWLRWKEINSTIATTFERSLLALSDELDESANPPNVENGRNDEPEKPSSSGALEELSVLFASVGMDVTHLQPVIFKALLTEAMNRNAELAFMRFINACQFLSDNSDVLTDNAQAALLVAIYSEISSNRKWETP